MRTDMHPCRVRRFTWAFVFFLAPATWVDIDTHAAPDAGGPADAGLSADGGTETVSSRCDWVTIEGGAFMMGSPEGVGLDREWPRHPVDVATFEMLRTEVTTAHYEACVDAGVCTENDSGNHCNRGEEFADHPITCVDWYQAREFCDWVGGRLPTEAEWEYAATSGGKDILYPWGDEPATCERAVTDGESGTDRGCGLNTTWPVCSKPLGNSDQGLCDLAGNVYEWVEDWRHRSYEIVVDDVTYYAPDDGSAWMEPITTDDKIMRGGGISSDDDFRAAFRQFHEPEFEYGGLGIRCVRGDGPTPASENGTDALETETDTGSGESPNVIATTPDDRPEAVSSTTSAGCSTTSVGNRASLFRHLEMLLR